MILPHNAPIPQSLYLHYPLCQHTCSYCDFNVYTRSRHISYDSKWLDSLETHLSSWLGERTDLSLRTLYLGGGTPSLLEPDSLHRLVDALKRHFDWSKIEEFTLELNPESCESHKLQAWKSVGVNRLSVGVQSFKPKILKRLERLATEKKIEQSLQAIRESGFEFSLDLMFGLPDQSLQDFEEDIERALLFDPDHLSCYLLTLKEDHPWLRSKFMQDRWAEEESVEKMYEVLCEKMSEKNYKHYEISNFAKAGKESRHNKNYWDVDSGYFAFGPGAHGYVVESGRRYRYENLKDLNEWATSTDGVGQREILDESQTQLEAIYFSFRTRDWFPISSKWPAALIEKMLAEGIMERRDDFVRLAERKWILIDSVVPRLLRSV